LRPSTSQASRRSTRCAQCNPSVFAPARPCYTHQERQVQAQASSGRVASLISQFENSKPLAATASPPPARSQTAANAAAVAAWPLEAEQHVDVAAWAAEVISRVDIRLAQRYSKRVSEQVQHAAKLAQAVLAAQAMQQRKEAARRMESIAASAAAAAQPVLGLGTSLDISQPLQKAANQIAPVAVTLGAKTLGALVFTGAVLHSVIGAAVAGKAAPKRAAAAAAATASSSLSSSDEAVTPSSTAAIMEAAAPADTLETTVRADPVRALIHEAAVDGPLAIMARGIAGRPSSGSRSSSDPAELQSALRQTTSKFFPSPAAVVDTVVHGVPAAAEAYAAAQAEWSPEQPAAATAAAAAGEDRDVGGSIVRSIVGWLEALEKATAAAKPKTRRRKVALNRAQQAAVFEAARAEASNSQLMSLLPLMAGSHNPKKLLAAASAFEALLGAEGAGLRARHAAVFRLLDAAKDSYRTTNLPAWRCVMMPGHMQLRAEAGRQVERLVADLQAFHSMRPLTKVLVGCTEGEVLSILATLDQQLLQAQQAAMAEAMVSNDADDVLTVPHPGVAFAYA